MPNENNGEEPRELNLKRKNTSLKIRPEAPGNIETITSAYDKNSL